MKKAPFTRSSTSLHPFPNQKTTVTNKEHELITLNVRIAMLHHDKAAVVTRSNSRDSSGELWETVGSRDGFCLCLSYHASFKYVY